MRHTTTRRIALALLLAAVVGAAHAQSLDTRFEYDALGRPTVTLDAAGNVERNTWDALGRLKSEANSLDERTTYGYAGADAPTSVEAPNGAVTTFEVDGLGQVRSESSPDRGTTTYIHDAAGNLTSRIDARGARMDTAYDVLNRPTERRFLRPDGTLEATHTYSWDSAPHGVGRLAAVTTGTNTLEFAYTPAGELAARAYARGGVLLAALWDYHPTTGQLLSLTYPSGSVIAYQYDAAGRPVQLAWDGVPIAADIEYFPFGPPTAILLANGLDHLRTYDTAGRLAAFTLAGETVEIGYDAAGRIVALSPATGTRVQQFGYDPAGRLTDYQALTTTEAYTYDANGNRTRRSANGLVTAYDYSPFSNRLTQVGNWWTVTYDAAGNATAPFGRFATYDSSGRAVEVRTDWDRGRYEYNGLGERVYKATYSFARHYVYDQAGHLLGEYDETGRPLMEYAWLGDLPVAVRRYRYPDGVQQVELFAVETDHLGTPRVVTDANQQVRWRWHSRPFGDSTPDENPSGLGAFTFNLRFPGQYYDAESGLHYNYFRDYDPGTGRYVQSDPIGLDGGINTYAYVGANPTAYVDPVGLYQMCHRDLLVPIPYARHCFMKFDDGSTSSYDPSGVNPDPDPNQEGTMCTKPKEPDKDDCIKKAMKKCEGSNYSFTGFNCCHCAEQAMKACGASVPRSSWPNWPMNPGPQPGEPGYSPSPVYDSTLGQ